MWTLARLKPNKDFIQQIYIYIYKRENTEDSSPDMVLSQEEALVTGSRNTEGNPFWLMRTKICYMYISEHTQ